MTEKKRVLITGGTGFIGRNMTEAMAADPAFEVRATHFSRPPADIPEVDWMHADLTDKSDVARALKGIDVLIHAAAVTSGVKDVADRPHIHVTDNAVMNSLVFRECFDRKLDHVVFFSCTVMHQPSERALTEDDFDANAPMHPAYFGAGWTKVYFEKMSAFFAGRGDTRFTVVRHSNVYGPHDKFDLERSHMFGATVTKVMTAADGGSVTVWGDGGEGRDLIHVPDLVAFVRLAIDGQETPFEIYNVGCGRAYPVKEVARRIIVASGKDLDIRFDDSRPSVKSTLFLDCSKAKRDLGWEAVVDLDEGIAMTLEWWRKNEASRN